MTAKQNKKKSLKIKFSDEDIGSILNSIGEAVVTLDKKYNIISFNPVAEKITGYSSKEVLGKSARTILKIKKEESGKNIPWPFTKVVKERKIVTLSDNSNLETKHKRDLPIAYNISPLRDSSRLVIGLIIVFRDVTKEREVQQMKSEFVSIVSHQLRTPSSAVKWYLETMIDNRRGNKMNRWQVEHLEQAYQSNERMINLINDLLNVSRLESGKLKLDFKSTQIKDIFKSVITEMDNFARANNVEVICRICKKTPPEVLVDVDKVRQVIQNLVNNAIKYTAQGKKQVIVDCRRKGKLLHCWVQDHGIGIPKAQQERIFERFFRAENAIISQTEGSGLGLYIAKQILNLHNGNIWLKSIENKGTTFHFTLPIATKTKK